MNTTTTIQVTASISFTKHEGVTTRTVNKVDIPSLPLNVAQLVKQRAMNDAGFNLMALQMANGICYEPFSATKLLGHRTAKGWQTINKGAQVSNAVSNNPEKAAQLAQAVADVLDKAERKTAVNFDMIHKAAQVCGLIEVKAKAESDNTADEDKLEQVAANAAKYSLAAFMTEYLAQMVDKGAVTVEQSKALRAAINTK